jgi:hypothetical protein
VYRYRERLTYWRARIYYQRGESQSHYGPKFWKAGSSRSIQTRIATEVEPPIRS